MTDTDLRYPVGRFDRPQHVTAELRRKLIAEVAAAPAQLIAAVQPLDPDRLDTPYRDGGWTVRQVVHHLPDSHMNAYVRFKLALTETEPLIKTYEEAAWATLADSKLPISVSLDLYTSLHQRWVPLLESLGDGDFAKSFRHPEWGLIRLDTTLALYAWHGRHHVGHVTALRARMGW